MPLESDGRRPRVWTERARSFGQMTDRIMLINESPSYRSTARRAATQASPRRQLQGESPPGRQCLKSFEETHRSCKGFSCFTNKAARFLAHVRGAHAAGDPRAESSRASPARAPSLRPSQGVLLTKSSRLPGETPSTRHIRIRGRHICRPPTARARAPCSAASDDGLLLARPAQPEDIDRRTLVRLRAALDSALATSRSGAPDSPIPIRMRMRARVPVARPW
jgi:hypothetical protein